MVYTLDGKEGRELCFLRTFPVAKLVSVYRGEINANLLESIRTDGIKYPIFCMTDDKRVRVRTGKQRVAACIELGISTVPVMVWDAGRILGPEWERMESEEQASSYFSDNYTVVLYPKPHLSKVLEDEYV